MFLTKESKKQLRQSLSKPSIYYIFLFFTIHSINMSDLVFPSTRDVFSNKQSKKKLW